MSAKIEFDPLEGLALWIPLPAEPGKAFLRTAAEHSVRVGFLALTVPAGFYTDAASIPGCVAWMFPSKVLMHVHRAGIFHDYAYRVQVCSRWQADALFRTIMEADGVGSPWAFLCWAAVRLFGWMPWREHGKRVYESRRELGFDPKTEGNQSRGNA